MQCALAHRKQNPNNSILEPSWLILSILSFFFCWIIIYITYYLIKFLLKIFDKSPLITSFGPSIKSWAVTISSFLGIASCTSRIVYGMTISKGSAERNILSSSFWDLTLILGRCEAFCIGWILPSNNLFYTFL